MGTINRGVIWVDGQFLTAADLNGEFNIVHDEFNGNIDDANVKAAAAIAGTKIAPDFGAQAVTLQELAADPNALADKGRVYTKDVSGGTELFYRDAAGNVVQVTSGGVLSSAIIILPGYIHGLELSNNAVSPASVIDVAVGACEVKTAAGADPEVLTVSSALDINLAASGAGGLDTGSPGINWYHAYIIYDPAGPTIEAMCSLSATSPTLPGGYTKFRRIGTFYNTASGSASIRRFIQFGKGETRRYVWSAGLLTALSAGASGTYASVNLATMIPATAGTAHLIGEASSASLPGEFKFSHDGTNDQIIFGWNGNSGTKAANPFSMVLNPSAPQTVYYLRVSGSTSDLDAFVQGYEESI